MPEILTAGEILVEIMRKQRDVPLWVQGDFSGPYPSGAPAIFIDQVACLGHSAGIVGAVGNDEFGYKILRRLSLDGVDISLVRRVDEAVTAVAFVSYAKSGVRKFLYHIARAAAGHITKPPSGALDGVKVFHVMGCSLMVSEEMRGVIVDIASSVKGNGGLISFDPNIRVELLGGGKLDEVIRPVLKLTDVLIPGERELLSITGKSTQDEACRWLFSKGIEMVVIKRGRDGARFVKPGGVIDVASFPVDEVDPTGAGDAFDAGFMCGLIEKLPPDECLRLASACGALNASYFGPMEGVFNRDYVEYFIKKRSMAR